MDRPKTGYSARWQDFGVALDGESAQLIFFENHNKTNKAGVHGKRAVAIPVGNDEANLQRRIGALLLRFKKLKMKLCPELAADGAAFWAIGGDPPPASWTSVIQNDWLQEALGLVGAEPPENFTWTAYSLRHGAASAAAALSAPMPKIRHLGGWAKRSTTAEDHYIDPLVRMTAAGRAFFGFLVDAR
jgi:hypothetical protein